MIESAIYPQSPISVPEELTKPTKKYQFHAWLALGGLCLFVGLYGLLTYLFFALGIELILNNNGVFIGVFLFFCGVFMLKGLFFFKKLGDVKDIEITEKEYPDLFHFIYQVADEAKAPRPHKIFLSPRVNACVFYDLSLINLVYPTKKNLEIGLGLVNVLKLNEFKAVIAHEFGHFAQKTMAVGRWVYIARQVAVQIIEKRDALDNFIRSICYTDVRIAWIGWILATIIWSIRSLIESVFMIVVMAERALSREMEFQADSVAVSLAGSDAIVNGLYRLDTADQAWDKAVNYFFNQYNNNKLLENLFTVQTYYIHKTGMILDKADYGQPPMLENPSQQRAFKKHLANPPKMWATHPSGFEREENAKKIYIDIPKDDRSAWILFQSPKEIQEKMTLHLLNYATEKKEPSTQTKVSTEEAQADLDSQYNKRFYSAKYRGFYLNQPLTQSKKDIHDFYIFPIERAAIPQLLTEIYPPSLKQKLEELENKREELLMLNAVHEKAWDATGGVIVHEGREISRRELPNLIQNLSQQVTALEADLTEQNCQIRSLHAKIASEINATYIPYLQGLMSVIHYCEHTIRDLMDVDGYLQNTLAIILADKRVTSSEMQRLLSVAGEYYGVLGRFYTKKEEIFLDETILHILNMEDWKSSMEAFKLGKPTEENINEWLNFVGSWTDLATNRLHSLRNAALEVLLKTEDELAQAYLQKETLKNAPKPAIVPKKYTVLLEGEERKLQSKLGLWEQFYTGDGVFHTILRSSVSIAIIGIIFYSAFWFNGLRLFVYNGLSIPVVSEYNGKEIEIEPFSFKEVNVAKKKKITIKTRTKEGKIIEAFEEEIRMAASNYVYNIASASLLARFDVYYSATENTNQMPSETLYGPVKWMEADLSYFFVEPPETIEMPSGVSSVSRSCLMALGTLSPSSLLALAKTEKDSSLLIESHVKWDNESSNNLEEWLLMAQTLKGGKKLIEERLQMYHNEVTTERVLQEGIKNKDSLFLVYQKRYEAQPNNPDLYYLMERINPNPKEGDAAILKGYNKWKNHAWLSYGAGYVFEEQKDYASAESAFVNAVKENPALTNTVSILLARIYRFTGKSMKEFPIQSEALTHVLNTENGQATDTFSTAISKISKGDFVEAIRIANNNPALTTLLTQYIAASDNADPSYVKKMLLTDEESSNDNTYFMNLGTRLREGQDIQQQLKKLGMYAKSSDFLLFEELIVRLKKGAAISEEEIFSKISLPLRGHAYCIAAIYLKEKCPKQWKENAKKLLFALERPYFK